MERHVYMNDIDNGKKIHMTYNKREALKIKKENGGIIRFMSYGLYNYSSCAGDITHGWDYPTFVMQSDILEVK